jgi:hypothetical protein
MKTRIPFQPPLHLGMFVCESGKSDADPGYDCLAAAQQALAIPIGWI